MIKTTALLIVFTLLLYGCDSPFSISYRSGSLDDDYIAEPLSDRSAKYEKALNISNQFIERSSTQDYNGIYDELFADSLANQVSKESYLAMMAGVEKTFGQIVHYKPLQWGFFSCSDNDQSYLCSVKIVEHEKGMAKYLFIFVDDGEYKKLSGLKVKKRNGVSPPGIF